MDVTGSQGVQAGDGNLQINFFPGQPQRGPVVAGNVPLAPPAFQPREDLMAELRAAGPGVAVVRAVTGLRGVGKTQLAAAYARQCVDAGWRLVAWVNAEDTPGILSGLAVVADRLGISRPGTDLEAIGDEVRNWLEADGHRCLIVYDNATEPDLVVRYVPSAGESQVLITSTRASVLDLGSPTQVDVFTDRESLDFLTERTKLRDSAGARTLASEVGHLPLALAQAAAVIKAQRLSYPVYLTRLRDYPTQRYLPQAKGDRYPRGVAEAILLSIDAVTAADPSGICAELLAVISLLSPEGVPRALLYGDSGQAASDASAAAGGAPVGRAAEIDEALSRLADASLLTFGGDDESEPIVTAHRLVMRVTRERHAHDGTMSEIGVKTCYLMAAAFRSVKEPWRHRAAARDLVRQVMALNDHLAPYLTANDTILAEYLLLRRGWAVWCLNQLADSAAQAADLGALLLADLERVFGDSHPDTLTARSNLAVAWVAAGRAGDAVPLLERTLADRVRLQGETHRDTLMSRNNLAETYRSAGRAADAVPLLERTLADCARLLGESAPETVMSRNNLAASYLAAGRTGDAAALLERTLADRIRVLGESHPDTLTSRNNLAQTYRTVGRLREAIAQFEAALAGFERVLGAEHPSTVTVRANLALARQEAIA